MGKDNFSFDIVSEVNLQEVDNAVNQARKEMSQRYDFKNSKATIEFSREEKKITIFAEDEFKRKAIIDMLAGKLVKRGVSLKSLIFKDPQSVFGGNLNQVIELAMGISKEQAKDLSKTIKDMGFKVQVQIEGEKLRVSSPKKDDLQSVIARLRSLEFPVALTFCNYR